ncbi:MULTISPECIES: TonB-dependent receptor domain-containing protein [Asticcacaulis]|uniref:TonB-dependent receptor plug domain-containing protein n=1 Tax=Asticcacaulis TaxID=76890 RepID=UPI0028591B83|nr:TonB-dependent receptor [Asticcacaulis sp. BE141]MBP2160539.1 iron complex outermembrane receptor protein [Asticcacaulis solisilvae]MDR6801584.1 iron complex outermembrane receptor protein [Asticcacaulis sp. BE141]
MAEEVEEDIIIQSTRSRRRIQAEPLRVEVITREEIEEKALMKPGNVGMLVSEIGGIRVQVTSPALGASNVRVQGMNGRYTQVLADGLPLYGGQASSLGLLQVPPTDLGQVEVIKGAASALYGPSALGGVINLISRRPGEEPETELLFNATSRDGQDITAYTSAPLSEHWRYSITGGLHRQSEQDIDKDGWLDIPGYDRVTVRPRFFWQGDNGSSAFITLGAMTEQRDGGTAPGRTAPDGLPFEQSQDTTRLDAGLVAETPLEGWGTLHIRASAMSQEHGHRFGAVIEDDAHRTAFAEASIAREAEGTTWLTGLAVQLDDYKSEAFPSFDYTYTVPALFTQVEHDFRENLTVAASARIDVHSEFGTKLSPRLSALYRPGPWTFRGSVGGGFYATTPFVEETDAAGLSRLDPLVNLRAETAQNGSFEIGFAKRPFEINVALFASNMTDTVRLEPVDAVAGGEPERVRLVNVEGQTRVRGAETLLRYRWKGVTVTGSYVYVDATEPDLAGTGRRVVPLTPKHTAGIVAMWEKHDVGRIGAELYYTGHQDLEDNPYRSKSKPYYLLGLMGEKAFGNLRVFLNLENILDVRQSRYDPMLLQQRSPEGLWTVDAWAPTDGFTVNAGIRVRFGGADHD